MSASLRATQQALDDLIDPARIQKRWNKHDERWAEAADVSLKTLQRFWSREPIRRANFIAICQAINTEDWKAIADLNQSPVASISVATSISPAVYNQATWVERSAVTESLLSILKSPCRILAITGITGIGKTALAERLVAELEDGKQFCRLNLNNGGLTPDFLSSGAALLRVLGEEPTLEDQKDPKNLLAHLLQLLSEQPYHVQIDSLEHLLVGNDREGWSEFQDSLWQDLFQQVLAGNQCQSQLLLTTQDIPGELDTIGSCYPQFWHREALQGLSEVEQLTLFHKFGLPLDPSSQGYLERIGKLYEGHPLVLRVIAADINACGCDVARYWEQCRFTELEAKHPVRFSRQKLQREVKQRVKISLERLPDDAYQLLCSSAVYRRPVPDFFWLPMLPERPEAQQQAALNILLSRGFAEEDWKPGSWLGAGSSIPLRQHNLIRSVAYDLLKTDVPTWQVTEHRAAELWLTAYEPPPDIPNLEKVRGYLEAFHHYCEVEAWESAKAVLWDSPNTSTEYELHWKMQIWGYNRELVNLCIKLLNKLSIDIDIVLFRRIGNAYDALGEYNKAIQNYQKSLVLAREINDKASIGRSLGNLGIAYYFLGQYNQAIEYQEASLDTYTNIEDIAGIGRALGNIGLIYHTQGNQAKALEYYQRDLEIAQQVGDLAGVGITLGNLGNVHRSLQNYEQAIEFYRSQQEIAIDIGDKSGLGRALGDLGETFLILSKYSESLDYLQESLSIFREIGASRLEAEVLKVITELYQKTGQIDRAIEYCQQALTISNKLGIPLAEECRKMKEALEKGK
jgi:tetratricopeptide (TPR) repeat protein